MYHSSGTAGHIGLQQPKQAVVDGTPVIQQAKGPVLGPASLNCPAVHETVLQPTERHLPI